MSTAPGIFDCAEVERAADAYVDAELVDEDRADLERHLAGCAACAKRVRQQAAWKANFKAAAPRPAASAALRARVAAGLNATHPEPVGWRRTAAHLVPVAAAAALLVGFAIHYTHRSVVADVAIDTYRSNLPLDVTGPAETVRAFLDPRVNVAVRPPQLPGAALVGARVQHIDARPVPYLVYDVGGARVSVIVFDPTDLPIEARDRRQVAGRDVYLDGNRGYHVALVRQGGLGYAYASDLDEDRMIQLVSSTLNH